MGNNSNVNNVKIIAPNHKISDKNYKQRLLLKYSIFAELKLKWKKKDDVTKVECELTLSNK